MTDNITNKDYITITDTKVMVDGKETTEYRGWSITCVQSLPKLLKDIQTTVKERYGIVPTEMHALSSKTTGNYAKSGTPSAKHGKNKWARFIFANGFKTPWVFYCSASSEDFCAADCAHDCGYAALYYFDFQEATFGPVAAAIKDEKPFAQVKLNASSQSDRSVIQVKPKVVSQSGDVTAMEIDFGKQKLQFQINARSLLKSNGK